MGEDELDIGYHEVAEGVEHDADEHALRIVVQPGVHEGHPRGAQGMLEVGLYRNHEITPPFSRNNSHVDSSERR